MRTIYTKTFLSEFITDNNVKVNIVSECPMFGTYYGAVYIWDASHNKTEQLFKEQYNTNNEQEAEMKHLALEQKMQKNLHASGAKENLFYMKSEDEAIAAGELDEYERSFRISMHCVKEIQDIIAKATSVSFDADIIHHLIAKYGYERVKFCLCVTIDMGKWRKCVSKSNIDWSQELYISKKHHKGYIFSHQVRGEMEFIDAFVTVFREVTES